MPKIERIQLRMNCKGMDLAHPVDRMAEGNYPYLRNVRALVEGRLESRPGYSKAFVPGTVSTPLGPYETPVHSYRRLNDVDRSHAAEGYAEIVGGNDNLYKDNTQVDTGYSGNPLSLLTFRPETSSEHWMYVYDSLKQSKVLPDGTVQDIGVAPPQAPLNAEYGTPAWVQISDTSTAAGWARAGSHPFTSIGMTSRLGAATTIAAIMYNVGTTGWACIMPTSVSTWFGTGDRMQVVLNTGQPNVETVVIREIHPAITTTTVTGTAYDTGSNGLCSMVLVGNPIDIQRNSVIVIAGEYIRVLSVTPTPDGIGYAIRCSTVSTVAPGATVTGALAWYVYTGQPHVAAETITASVLMATSSTPSPSPATQTVSLLTSIDASQAIGRPISIADDYMHISVWVVYAQNFNKLAIKLDIDPGTTNLTNAFTRNYYVWELLPADIFGEGATPSLGSWYELVIPLSEGIRVGDDKAANLSTIKAIQLESEINNNTPGGSDLAFCSWYLFGTYGATILPNAPTGFIYATRNRVISTGAYSVPGPPTRYELFPLREAVYITPDPSTQTGVDTNDIFRQGGAETDLTYVGSIINNIEPFLDSFSSTALIGSPIADLTALQPWPILQKPRTGVVDVIGTTVYWISGDPFDLALLSATVIKINGYNYQTYGQPISTAQLEITQSAGVQASVTYEIDSPTLAGQPLPYAFGPLEGPFAPVVFALGDDENAGTLYFTNNTNLDAASDSNTLDLCPPSEPLISGQAWNGIAIVGSRDNLYQVRYSFTDTAPFYQFKQIPVLSGMWSRWASCKGPDGVYYLGRDGIYRATDQGADIVGRNSADGTDPLYPLFPHDGKTATPVIVGGDTIYPVDMSRITSLRLSCADQDIYFEYFDTNTNRVTLRYNIPLSSWFLHQYAAAIETHYLVEESVDIPSSMQLALVGRETGYIYKAGGNTDDGTAISSRIYTPSLDAGDERAQKLYVDAMTDADQEGTLSLILAFNDLQDSSGESILTLTGAIRKQLLTNFAALGDIRLYRNVGALYTWTGGPAGPRIYAFEPSGYIQPYVSKSLITQVITLGDADWKHHRRIYAAYISNGEVEFTILCQDGRVFGPYILPATAGKFRVIPVMVDHGCKDLAFGYSLVSVDQSLNFALFPNDFTIETKSWMADAYVKAAVFAA